MSKQTGQSEIQCWPLSYWWLWPSFPWFTPPPIWNELPARTCIGPTPHTYRPNWHQISLHMFYSYKKGIQLWTVQNSFIVFFYCLCMVSASIKRQVNYTHTPVRVANSRKAANDIQCDVSCFWRPYDKNVWNTVFKQSHAVMKLRVLTMRLSALK